VLETGIPSVMRVKHIPAVRRIGDLLPESIPNRILTFDRIASKLLAESARFLVEGAGR
jgi:hypothetical protein